MGRVLVSTVYAQIMGAVEGGFYHTGQQNSMTAAYRQPSQHGHI